MQVALSSRAEVMLVMLRWLQVGAYQDNANYIFAFGHFPRCRITLKTPREFVKHGWKADSKAGKQIRTIIGRLEV